MSLTDKEIQKKLNQLKTLCNELDEEAKRRYGQEGMLYFEADGNFHIMSGDCEGSARDRQEFVKFSSSGYCKLGAGAW